MQATTFSLTDIQTDKIISLADYKHINIMLTFWVSWCPDCHLDLPKNNNSMTTRILMN